MSDENNNNFALLQEYLIPAAFCGVAAVASYFLFKQQNTTHVDNIDFSLVEDTKKKSKAKTKKVKKDSKPTIEKDDIPVSSVTAKSKKQVEQLPKKSKSKKVDQPKQAKEESKPKNNKKATESSKKKVKSTKPTPVAENDDWTAVGTSGKTVEKEKPKTVEKAISKPIESVPVKTSETKAAKKQEKPKKQEPKKQEPKKQEKPKIKASSNNMPAEVMAQLEAITKKYGNSVTSNSTNKPTKVVPPVIPVADDWQEIKKTDKKPKKEREEVIDAPVQEKLPEKPKKVIRVSKYSFSGGNDVWNTAEAGAGNFNQLVDNTW